MNAILETRLARCIFAVGVALNGGVALVVLLAVKTSYWFWYRALAGGPLPQSTNLFHEISVPLSAVFLVLSMSLFFASLLWPLRIPFLRVVFAAAAIAEIAFLALLLQALLFPALTITWPPL